MIALIIVGIIIFILILLLILPLTVDLICDDNFVLRIKYSGIKVFDNQKQPKQKKVKKSKKNNNKSNKKKDNFIVSTYKQKGFSGTISYFSDILKLVFKKTWWLLKRVKFRRFNLDVIIGSADAAATAINYGRVCAATYPVLALLETNADFKAKSVNISADFDKNQSEFRASILIRAKLIVWIVCIGMAISEYFKLQRKESEKYERKQQP